MNRVLIIVGVIVVLACLACLGVGALLVFVQSQPVAQVTPPARVTTSAANPTSPAVILATPVQPVAAPTHTENGITVSVNRFTNNFPTRLLFDLSTQSNAKITQLALFVALDGQSSSSRQVPAFTSDAQVQTTYEWNLNRNYLPPGVSGQFWWTVQDSAGGQLTTPKQSFRVDDTTQQWKKIANGQLALYWYSGDNSFGQALFDRGVQAMKFLQQDTGVTVDNQIQIFIYGNRTDFFNSLEPGASEWTGGRAFPEYGIVLIDIAPSNLDWGLGATTHELTHQVIHQKIKSPLGDLSMPHWMDEGLAVYYETYPGTLDAQFSIPLKRAIQNDSLQQLRSLSGSFPADSNAANLSYAESYSVVDFIIRHYGRDKLAQLLQGFKTGGSYDDIFKQILGVDTDGLENQWRQDVGAKVRVIPSRAATTPTAFPTFSLSTDATPTPGK
jgi:Peptidase MA superfamily